MKHGVTKDFYTLMLAEGRTDMIVARPALTSLAVWAWFWDMLSLGIIWQQPHGRFFGAEPLVKEYAFLSPAYDHLIKIGANTPLKLWYGFLYSNEPIIDMQNIAVISSLKADGIIDKSLSPNEEAVLRAFYRVRNTALGNWYTKDDVALLLLVNKATFLKEQYFKDKGEQAMLYNRLRDIKQNAPAVCGFQADRLIDQFCCFDALRNR